MEEKGTTSPAGQGDKQAEQAPPKHSDHKRMQCVIAIVLYVFLWTGFIPGCVASCDGVFDDEGVRDKALQQKTPLQSVLRDTHLRNAESFLSYRCLADKDIAMAKNCFEARQALEQERTSHQLRITGFRHNSTTVVFLVSYLSLSGVLVILAPPGTPVRWWRVLAYGVAAYLPMLTWSVLRNQYPDDPRRTLISYVNLDISLCSFVLQELRILVMFLMLAAIWDKWHQHAEHAEARRKRDENLEASTPMDRVLALRTGMVSGAFGHWQLVSFCIGLALLPWTFEYWLDIVRSGDTRYWFSAATMHLACAVTWFIVTIPLWRAMHAWSQLRDKALRKYLDEEDDRRFKWASDLKPIGNVEFITSAVVVGLSFFIPIFRAFLG